MYRLSRVHCTMYSGTLLLTLLGYYSLPPGMFYTLYSLRVPQPFTFYLYP